MNSIEKLARFQAGLNEAQPEDEQTARMIQLAQLAGPMIGPMLPEDPAVLDEQLLALCIWLLEQRSDDAPVAAKVATAQRPPAGDDPPAAPAAEAAA